MPIRPEDLDFMQSYLNGAPREDLQARLDSMYGPVTPDMRQAAFGGPDTRTAQNMSTEPAMSVEPAPSPFVPTPENIEAAQRAAPPAPPPVATDAGGMSTQAPAISEGPAMSTVSPEQLASMGQQAEARLASAQAPTAAPSGAALPPPQSPENAEMQRYLIGGYRGGGGRVVPGGEQLASRTVTRELRAPLSPETAEELDYAERGAEGLAVAQGEGAAGMLEKQAAQQSEQAKRAREDLAQYKRNTAAKQAEYDMQRSQLDDMRAQVQREPITFWSGKDTGTQIMNGIGLFLLGLGGGPQVVQQVIDRDIAVKEKARGTEISLLQDQLNRFKEGIPSPEAQQLYTRSLGLDAAAAEADRMANLAKAEDARQRGFALAEQLRREALQARAAAQSVSLGKEEIKTANVPTKVVGGAPGGMAGLLKRAKELGLTPEHALYLANRGELPTSSEVPNEAKDIKRRESELERRVVLPNGKEAFAGSAKAAEGIQGSMDAATQLLSNYDALEREVKAHSVTGQLDREALGRIRASIADNITTLKDLKGLGVLSKSDLDLINPLSGAQAEDAIIGPQFQGAIQRARQIVNRKADIETAKLLARPWGSERVGKAQSAVSGFKPE
jgi:hypothetical protein